MVTKTSRETKVNFDCSLLQKMVDGDLDSFYLMYDDTADELVVKFIEPKNPTSYISSDENWSIIVDPVAKCVVGLSFMNFAEEFLAEPIAREQWKAPLKILKRKYVKILSERKEKQIFTLYNDFLQTLGPFPMEKCFA